MTDWVTAILTGFFTGIGVAVAQWIKERKLDKHLDRLDNMVKTMKGAYNNNGKGGDLK